MATTTTNELGAMREELSDLIARAAETIEQEQRSLAAAAEQLSQDLAVQAAWRQGGAAMQGRIVALIDQQLATLHHGGMNATCLETLRRMVMEVIT